MPPLIKPKAKPVVNGLAGSKTKRADNTDSDRHDSKRCSQNGQDGKVSMNLEDFRGNRRERLVSIIQDTLYEDDHTTSMPEAWVRASILVRVNSLASAYSGVRSSLIITLTNLLKHDICPRIRRSSRTILIIFLVDFAL